MSRKTTIKKNLEELEELLRLVEKKVYVHRESLFIGIENSFVCVSMSYLYILSYNYVWNLYLHMFSNFCVV